MRRAAAAIVITAVGLVLLLSFKSHAGSSGPGIASLVHVATPAPAPSATTPTKTKAPASPKAVTTRNVTGSTYDTRYGPVQVQITLEGSKLTDVQALQLPQQS